LYWAVEAIPQGQWATAFDRWPGHIIKKTDKFTTVTRCAGMHVWNNMYVCELLIRNLCGTETKVGNRG